MKRQLTLLTFCLGLSFFPYPSQAQEHQGCYMLDSNGRPVDLNGLCENRTATATTPGVFRAPIKRRQAGIPIIEVSFNNQPTVEMMVDTGASATLLPDKIAKQLGIKKEGIIVANTPSQRGVKFPAGRVNSINAAGAEAKDVVVVISPALSTGLLGQNFFSRYDVVIKENVVEFRDR
jgi:aspartyl protease family protein